MLSVIICTKARTKASTMKRSGWFSPLLAQKPLARSHHFMVHVQFCQNQSLLGPDFVAHIGAPKGAQLGVLVPKKLVPRAVDRNTIKRISRAQWLAQASSVVGLMGFMVLIRYTKPTSSVPFEHKHRLNQELGFLLSQAIVKMVALADMNHKEQPKLNAIEHPGEGLAMVKNGL